jgi:hypothetical protein
VATVDPFNVTEYELPLVKPLPETDTMLPAAPDVGAVQAPVAALTGTTVAVNASVASSITGRARSSALNLVFKIIAS